MGNYYMLMRNNIYYLLFYANFKTQAYEELKSSHLKAGLFPKHRNILD